MSAFQPWLPEDARKELRLALFKEIAAKLLDAGCPNITFTLDDLNRATFAGPVAELKKTADLRAVWE